MQHTSAGQMKLSRDHVVRMLDQPRAPSETLSLLGCDLTRIDLAGLHFQDVIFGAHPRTQEPARLERTSFRESSFDRCLFAHTDLDRTDFRACAFVGCDFRYATFTCGQLADASIRLSDFYRATFGGGTVMANVRLELVSLTSAGLEGAADLEWRSFKQPGGTRALVQESAVDYGEFVKVTIGDRPSQSGIEDAFSHRLQEAARTYRSLSGIWTGRGQFSDAGSAYVHSRRIEREAVGPRYGRGSFRPLAWLSLWLADLSCGFGESLSRVVGSVVLLALLPGLGYWLLGGVEGAHGLPDDLLFGASQLTFSPPADLTPSSRWVSVVGLLQTFLGVALLGLFGFVLGNKIRSS